jgi:hypothetical protein
MRLRSRERDATDADGNIATEALVVALPPAWQDRPPLDSEVEVTRD